ncbi:MAG: glycosyltransferase family 4 protein [Ilumatobacter sp.]|nr:glycosyltransferase family 4 protein [Ilumatobacter sp.]
MVKVAHCDVSRDQAAANSSPQSSGQHTILYLVTVDWWFALHRMHVAQAALDAGFRVIVATHVGEHEAVLRNAGLQVVPIHIDRRSLSPISLLRNVWSIARLYRRVRPDVVHHMAIKPTILGGVAAALTRPRAVVNNLTGLGSVFTDPAPARYRVLRPFVLLAFRFVLSRAASITIVENADDLVELEERSGVSSERLVLVPSIGVDLEAFPAAPEPDGIPVVRLAGRLVRQKGVHEFVEAARLLRRRRVEVRMQLVGAPDLDSADPIPEVVLRSWQREGVVEWLGWRSDMSAVWAGAHVAALPSYYREGVPVSLLEAASTTRAVVTTDVPGCRDAVRHGVTGLIVPPRDPHALAAAIEELVTDPARRREMGLAGRELVAERFSCEMVQAQTLAVYRRVLCG